MNAPEVAIIGAGPAGLAAAVTAAEAGIRVTIVDERPRPGGRLHYDLPGTKSLESYLADCDRLGITIRSNTIAWGLFPGWQIPLETPSGADRLDVDHVILATGSTDRALSFEGNTLPGVMTGSGLRRLIREFGVLPGKRAVVLGDGPDAALTADVFKKGGGIISTLLAENEARSIVARGDGGVQWIKIREREFPIDLIGVAIGRQPDVQLAAMGELELVWAPRKGGWVPRQYLPGDTIFVAGDAAGVDFVDICELDGALAATRLAAHLGLVAETAVTELVGKIEQRRPERMSTDAGEEHFQQPWRTPLEVN